MIPLIMNGGVIGVASTLVLWSVISCFVYLTSLAIYRLTLHPLAKYPGPFFAKITDWYSVYQAYSGDRQIDFFHNHAKYGPVFRYGPNSLSFNTNTALKSIYGGKPNVEKSQFYSVFPPKKGLESIHSSIDKGAHARKRRVLSHAFSETAMKSMEKYILTNIRSFCSKIGTQSGLANSSGAKGGWGNPLNMADWCNYLTFDVMGELAFGKAFDMLEHEEERHVIKLVANASWMHLILGCYPMMKTLGLNKVLFREINNTRMQYMAYSKKQFGERMKIGYETDRKDFFYYLLNAKDSETGRGFTSPELLGESNLIIIAGSDTTSTALASSFFYLTHNPETMKKLSEEILSTFSDVEEICHGPTLNSCHYLRAVVDEAMRLSPPVGGMVPRRVLPGGIDIDGHHIPEGTDVGVAAYALQHNAAYHPEPSRFIPERWIPDSGPGITQDSVSVTNSAFSPFSIGSRACIGKPLAYAEVMMALARVVYRYEFRLAPGTTAGEGSPELGWGRQDREVYQLKDAFTSFKDGPYVQFRERQVVA
ncbi:cytochrome P450 [Mollisia scopiformis]|uniref:Cytochrome P450 n=1 Tax=Mollisia scopiformis TaxID=149040 RepID=A0A194XCB1_MOLSC|nr:cytochrome P450 [Mollisia scopiformis]KUJ17796.1 cytochrome P450 [Mollisia scopiformis]